MLELLRRKEGTTIADIAKATDWKNNSIRGFISGTITKKMGFVVESSKSAFHSPTNRSRPGRVLRAYVRDNNFTFGGQNHDDHASTRHYSRPS